MKKSRNPAVTMIMNGSKRKKTMKIFYLKRTEDESGVSGTGRVAQGFVFDNGKVAVTWLSEHPSVTVYDTIGGFVGGLKGDMSGPDYAGPAWFTEGMKDVY